MSKQRVAWSESDKAFVAYVRFPDGSRKKAKSRDRATAQGKLDALVELRDTTGVAPSKVLRATFDEIVEAWLDAGAPNITGKTASGGTQRHVRKRSENTVAQARDTLRPNVTRPKVIDPKAHRKYPTKARAKAGIGELTVDQTTTETVNACFEAMAKDGLATSSIDRTWWHLSTALSWGVRKGMIKRNPAEDCLLPEPQEAKERKSISIEQMPGFLVAIAHDRLYALWLTALMVGTRPGEILGIRWPNLDIDSATPSFDVVERAHYVEKKYVGQAAPKTKRDGAIGLHPLAVAALLRHREEMIALGQYDPLGFVFPTRRGTPHSQGNVRKYLRRVTAKAGLGPEWTTYELRHSFVSIADDLLDGNLKLVGKVVGHASERTTLGYVHRVRPVIGHAVDVWDALMLTEDPVVLPSAEAS